MARTRREDWVERGFAVLREGGEAALKIERLCTELGRTKGAFYHHFVDVEDYTDALLSAWEDTNTSAPIVRAEAAKDLHQKRVALGEAVRMLDMRLDLAMRAWGLRDPRARAFVMRVDETRIAYLAVLYPDLSAPAAREMERTLHRALQKLVSDGDA